MRGFKLAKNETYELESKLYEIDYCGFIAIPLTRMYRLLGKGNRSSGTWKALLDVWEEMGGERKRSDLHIFEAPHEMLVITRFSTEPVKKWSGE